MGFFAFAILGTPGLRTLLGFAIFVFFPIYLTLENFGLNESETIIFSVFIGLITFSSLVYWIGFIISFKVSILAVFVLLLLTAYLAGKFRK